MKKNSAAGQRQPQVAKRRAVTGHSCQALFGWLYPVRQPMSTV